MRIDSVLSMIERSRKGGVHSLKSPPCCHNSAGPKNSAPQRQIKGSFVAINGSAPPTQARRLSRVAARSFQDPIPTYLDPVSPARLISFNVPASRAAITGPAAAVVAATSAGYRHESRCLMHSHHGDGEPWREGREPLGWEVERDDGNSGLLYLNSCYFLRIFFQYLKIKIKRIVFDV